MRLEKYTSEDIELYKRLVFNEKTMSKNYGRVFTEEEADMLFRCIISSNAEDGITGYYKVYADEYIGLGALTFDEGSGDLEIEYMLLPDYWGYGHGSELVRILTEMAEKAGLSSSVSAITDPENVRSRNILLKNGFRLVRSYINEDGEPAELYTQSFNFL